MDTDGFPEELEPVVALLEEPPELELDPVGVLVPLEEPEEPEEPEPEEVDEFADFEDPELLDAPEEELD